MRSQRVRHDRETKQQQQHRESRAGKKQEADALGWEATRSQGGCWGRVGK